MDILPCVIFTFNRPGKLKRVLKALRSQEVDRLIVFVDGARNEQDLPKVEQSHAIARSVDWAETELHFNDENRGLDGLIDNINLIFESYLAAVFVEDDCLPMQGFYSFMRQALTRYEKDERVFSIGAYQSISSDYFKEYPYSVISSPRFTCWGWSTWQRQWQKVKPDLERYSQLFGLLHITPEVAGTDLSQVAREAAAGKVINSWAYKVSIITLWHKMVHVLPTHGLVRNIGQDRSGSHGGFFSTLRDCFLHNRNVTNQLPEDIIWLEDTRIDCDYAAEVRDFVLKSQALSLKRIKNRSRVLLRRYFWPASERYFDLDLIPDRESPLTKRALLAYIVHPFSIPRDDPRFLRHINIWRANEIVRVLNRLGYVVDVIDYRDRNFVPHRTYDLFIGHGGVNFEEVVGQLPTTIKKIYFSTGNYWKFHNQQEIARFQALRQRRGVDLPNDRYIQDSEEAALSLADGIIGIGNEFTKETYSDFSPVVMINDTSLYDDHFDWCEKDYDSGRKHFVFYAGGGNVHKGLDLLLEAFAALDEQLWICTKMDKLFLNTYRKELFQHANIHLEGWVQPRSQRFYQVMRSCIYCILPSCSEGQAQSVLECMNQGLIPVVSRATGLDVGGYGVLIEPCTVEEIQKTVRILTDYSPEQCRMMSMKARTVVQKQYSEENFAANMKKALRTILQEG